jgi:hypothetical protein
VGTTRTKSHVAATTHLLVHIHCYATTHGIHQSSSVQRNNRTVEPGVQFMVRSKLPNVDKYEEFSQTVPNQEEPIFIQPIYLQLTTSNLQPVTFESSD